MTFLVFQALKGPKLIFLELSKTVFGFFVAQLATKLEVLKNFRVKNRVKENREKMYRVTQLGFIKSIENYS